MSPRQQAQQLKKQRFNKVVNDFAANNAFFFLFVRHPRLMTPEGILHLVEELKNQRQPQVRGDREGLFQEDGGVERAEAAAGPHAQHLQAGNWSTTVIPTPIPAPCGLQESSRSG